MGTVAHWLVVTLGILTLASYPTTLVLFARGDWHTGKRLLAATATFGFLLAGLLAIRWALRG